MAPTSSARGLAAMAEEVRPCWAGAKAAADATTEARIIDFLVEYRFVGLYIKLWGVRRKTRCVLFLLDGRKKRDST